HDDTGITTEFAASRDKVWQVLLDVHQELQLPLVGADPNTGALAFFLQSYNHRIADKRASTYVDCGSGAMGANADMQRVNVRLNENVATLGEGRTSLRIAAIVTSR